MKTVKFLSNSNATSNATIYCYQMAFFFISFVVNGLKSLLHLLMLSANYIEKESELTVVIFQHVHAGADLHLFHPATAYKSTSRFIGRHAARWESSASHRWYTPPDGTIKRAPPVVQAAQWDRLVRATGGTRRRERVKRRD